MREEAEEEFFRLQPGGMHENRLGHLLSGNWFSWSDTSLPSALPFARAMTGLVSLAVPVSGLLLGLPCPTPEAPVRGSRSLLELERDLGLTEPTLPTPGVGGKELWILWVKATGLQQACRGMLSNLQIHKKILSGVGVLGVIHQKRLCGGCCQTFSQKDAPCGVICA